MFQVCILSWTYSLREKCPYSELFWSAFSRIRTEYGEMRSIFPYSVRMRENTDQNNSKYGNFLRNDYVLETVFSLLTKIIVNLGK